MSYLLIILILGLSNGVYTQRGEDTTSGATSSEAKRSPDFSRDFQSLTSGAWVKYQIKRVQEGSAGFKTIWTSDIKMTVTGQEPGNKFWLELVVNEGEDYQKVFRFLVDETGRPLPEKLIIKRGKLNAIEMDLALWSAKTEIPAQELLNEAIGNFWRIPFPYVFKGAKPVAKDKLTLTLKGTQEVFLCQRYISDQVIVGAGAKVWLSNQVPLAGVARMLIVEDGYQTLFKLVGYGTNGRSIIKERPTQLNFKEKK